MGWMPIDTAPSDRPVQLGWWEKDTWAHEHAWVTRVGVAWFSFRLFGVTIFRRRNYRSADATHWKPAPDPPGDDA
jgi:hypothetical protein